MALADRIKKSEPKPKANPAEFFGKMFQLRDILHTRHLHPTSPGQLGSGWEHKVLNDLYDEILDLTDGIIESYQGKYGLIKIQIPASEYNNILAYLEEFVKFVENSYSMFPESWIQNELDNVQKEIYSAIYKLKYLK
jgi:hypothetical protein